MSYRKVIDAIAKCATIRDTQRVERSAFGRRAWPQVHADLIRLAAIAKRFELTRSDDCDTFVKPSMPLSRGSQDSITRRKERFHDRDSKQGERGHRGCAGRDPQSGVR